MQARLIAIVAAVASVVAVWFASPAGSTPGVVIVVAQSNPIEATGPGGATVGYTATAADVNNAAESITCTDPHGATTDASGTLSTSATFPLGNSTITCTGADAATSSATVTVRDTTPPTISSPGDQTAEATSSAGAVVSFSLGASDTVDPSPSVSCSPKSPGDTFPLGTTNETCTARDASGNTSSPVSFNVNVRDTTRPSLSNPGNQTVEAANASGAQATWSLNVSDAVDPSPVVSCGPKNSGDTFPLGTTNETCTATDHSNNSTQVSFSITVADTIPPTISNPGNQTIEATSASGAQATWSLNVSDAVDPSPTLSCAPQSSGTTFPLGTTSETCTATDHSNNSSQVSFSIKVVDTTPPKISNPGNQTVEATSASGAKVTFSATASDAIDPSPTVNCSPKSSGDVFPLGTTSETCTAKDASGNTSAPAPFTVKVQDTTAPTLTNPGNQTAEATSAAGAKVSFSLTATDSVDPSPSVTCSPKNSGDTFPLGTTNETCTAKDASGNSAQQPFTVTVRDTTPPTLSNPGDQTVEATGPSGAAVSFSLTASDTVDPSPSVTCAPEKSGDTFALGTTTETCAAKDASNNSASQSFKVNVVDTTAPTFNAAPSLKREANSPEGSVVTYTAPTAVDIVDGPIAAVTCNPAAGSVFPLGTTTVSCSAPDVHGNLGKTSFDVMVVDTTPPVLIVPGDRTYVAPSSAGEPSSFFTRLASATDIADPHPTISNDAPDVAPIGDTVVSFTARDASGNKTTRTSTMTVLPPGTAMPQTKVPDVVAPDNVSALAARPGDGVVNLSWKLPKLADLAYVEVTRAPADGSTPSRVVYHGTGASFRDRGLKNGVEYRYVVTVYDQAGNPSAGLAVVATPKLALLRSPRDGIRVSLKKKPPTFRWIASPNASYYNIQLFFGSSKVLSAWPVKNTYTLKRTWKYDGRRYKLVPGTYRWYVWPGIGARADVHYGDLLGSASFTVVR